MLSQASISGQMIDMIKPFALEELEARIRVLLRRNEGPRFTHHYMGQYST